jgi:hypothetical protein
MSLAVKTAQKAIDKPAFCTTLREALPLSSELEGSATATVVHNT